MKMMCWWNGEEGLAREVLVGQYLKEQAYSWLQSGIRVFTSWLHPIESDIVPGALVYAWDGKDRPEKPLIGYYDGPIEGYGFGISFSDYDNGAIFDHVEPVVLAPKIDWSKMAKGITHVVVFDSGVQYAPIFSENGVFEAGMHQEEGTAIAILHRPEEKP